MHPEFSFKFLHWSQKLSQKKVCPQLGVLRYRFENFNHILCILITASTSKIENLVEVAVQDKQIYNHHELDMLNNYQTKTKQTGVGLIVNG